MYETIIKYLGSPDAIYDFQFYQSLRWFFEQNYFAENVLSLCRAIAFDKNCGSWTRSYAIAILGEAGDSSDLEAIEEAYPTANFEVEKADLVRALAKMEKARRNTFFKKVEKDGFLIAQAAEQARELY